MDLMAFSIHVSSFSASLANDDILCLVRLRMIRNQ